MTLISHVKSTVKPKELRIAKPVGNLVAGEPAEMACQSKGSSPQATIEWIKDKQLMPRVGESFSEDGFITTSFITFVPTMDDNSKLLSCKATNPQFPEVSLEDGFIMNVHCKRNVFERNATTCACKITVFTVCTLVL